MIAPLAILTFGVRLLAADASFLLEASRPSPYTAAYLGNGVLGLETAPLGTEPTRCFLAGVYDHTEGDVPRIASAPAWNEVDVKIGSLWLNSQSPANLALRNYRQTLDLYDGVLRTSYEWNAGGHAIRVQVETFVSRARARTAATRVSITPEFSGPLQIRLPLRNFPQPRRYALERIDKLEGEAAKNQWAIWYPGHLDVTAVVAKESQGGSTLLSLLAKVPGANFDVGEAVAIETSPEPARVETHRDSEGAEVLLSIDAKPGATYTFTKYAALAWSSGDSHPDEAARQAATEARKAGWQRLYAEHTGAWHRLWESDIVVEGNPALQKSLHAMQFYLLGSMRQDLPFSTPPMGLSSAGYYGHVFWDADTFMFPPILILHPELARPMVAFRARTLEAARENARRNGHRGAMYPWEAGPDGEETTPRFANQNAHYENHINGDVALAAWQYWLATGDRSWLSEDAWPILRDTADFWASRVSFDAKQSRYEIGKVVAVNESLIGVNNDPYTNAVAKRNLELAAEAARVVGVKPDPKWAEIAAKMHVPDTSSPLLNFPLEFPWTPQEMRKSIAQAQGDIRRGETGAMMGGEFYPILAAELGDRQLIGELLEPLWKPYLRPPFEVVAETPDNQNTNFITGAGAFLQQFVFGYSGLRLGKAGLEKKFAPQLPPGIRRLILKNIAIRGKRETLVFQSTE